MFNFTDWLARTFFISSDQTATNTQVANAQAALVQQQVNNGTIDSFQAASLQDQIAQTSGNNFYDSTLGGSGTTGALSDILSGGQSVNQNFENAVASGGNATETFGTDGTITTNAPAAKGFNLFASLQTLVLLAIVGGVLYFFWPQILRWFKAKRA